MKKITFIVAMAISSLGYSQYNTTWYVNPSPAATAIANTSSAGYIGIGTRSTNGTANTPLPAFNLHLHGTADFIMSDKGGGNSVNFGKTTRLGLTNSTTGMTETDGVLFRLSENDLLFSNQEATGTIAINSPKFVSLGATGVQLFLDGTTSRAYMGASPSTSTAYAKLTMNTSSDNGLYIQPGTGKYGISVRPFAATDIAMQVMGTDGTTRNFAVQSNGYVFARQYKTTLGAIPDYVFQPGYELMPLSELRTYVTTNSHLPNIPSASEYAETGVDLGELNRLLLEKVEELTLYTLQLEERLQKLETGK